MLHFFRKHQKYIFFFTTIAVVISFAFFGTYQAMAPAFRGGKESERPYIEQMATFLGTEEWMQSRKLFAANYLNDGVVTQEFFETGMAVALYERFAEVFEKDLAERLSREKIYAPYVHPHSRTLSAEIIWSMLAPEIPEKLAALKHTSLVEAFPIKADLLLAQKRFPPAYLTQMVRYQERENVHIQRDPRLVKDDLVLFGYHDLSDWFGERYMQAMAQVIIDTANIARKKGYRVSRNEVTSHFLYRSQKAYTELAKHIDLPVKSGHEFFQLYLRQIGMKEATAIKIWEDVTLFRRMMHEIGQAALVDPSPLAEFYAFAHENATVELYQMPAHLRFTTQEEVAQFEGYLAAVAESREEGVPTHYAPLAVIEERAPELIGRRYALYIGKTTKEMLAGRVTMKETWDWECTSANWEKLKERFPELVSKTGEPFAILEALPHKTRSLIDQFARLQIVEMHPEWIDEALAAVVPSEKALFLTTVSKEPLPGISDSAALISLLSEQDEITAYTQDETHYYRILVVERGEEQEVLTFREAKERGLLSQSIESEEMGDPARYFYAYMAAYREGQQLEGELAKQWEVVMQMKTLARSEPTFLPIDQLMELEEGALTDLLVDRDQGVYYCRFLDKRVDTTIPMGKVVKIQELVSKEARYHYFNTLLNQIEI